MINGIDPKWIMFNFLQKQFDAKESNDYIVFPIKQSVYHFEP